MRARHVETARSILMIAAGGALALAPASFQAAGARLLPLRTQGLLALGLGVGAFLGQLVGAWVVEARLATQGDEEGEVPYPMTLLAAAACGTALVVVAPRAWESYAVGVPLLLAGLVVGRLVAVVGEYLVRELLASALLLTGLAAAALRGFEGPGSIRIIASSCLAATLVRCVRRRGRSRAVTSANQRWVLGETALLGVTQPLLNAVLLAGSGPVASVTFRAVSTISGALEPVISFARLRLLVSTSRIQIVLGGLGVASVTALLVACDQLGIFGHLLGDAWRHASLTALLVACTWRASTLVTTVPFTGLRRQGRTQEVFWLRVATAVWYLVVGLGISISGSVTLIFAGLLAAETSASTLYWSRYRRAAAVTRSPAAAAHRRGRHRRSSAAPALVPSGEQYTTAALALHNAHPDEPECDPCEFC